MVCLQPCRPDCACDLGSPHTTASWRPSRSSSPWAPGCVQLEEEAVCDGSQTQSFHEQLRNSRNSLYFWGFLFCFCCREELTCYFRQDYQMARPQHAGFQGCGKRAACLCVPAPLPTFLLDPPRRLRCLFKCSTLCFVPQLQTNFSGVISSIEATGKGGLAP